MSKKTKEIPRQHSSLYITDAFYFLPAFQNRSLLHFFDVNIVLSEVLTWKTGTHTRKKGNHSNVVDIIDSILILSRVTYTNDLYWTSSFASTVNEKEFTSFQCFKYCGTGAIVDNRLPWCILIQDNRKEFLSVEKGTNNWSKYWFCLFLALVSDEKGNDMIIIKKF